MKKILLLSDTHSLLDNFILKHTGDVDEIWHAGDLGDISIYDELKNITKVRMVYGNIDNKTIRAQIPLIQNFDIDGFKVIMTHIGGYPGHYQSGMKEYLVQEKPNLFISGHSHILKVIYDKKLQLLHMNPGAAGAHGFHQKRTMLKFSIENGEIKDLVLIEKNK
ncbi:MAG: metallophosphoesterase family protein [Flavobacteriaceae bacterium]